ncbi:MAG: transcription-repair coupling factor [Clostridiales bacterium]|nr:transcription-repair coupling factor [Clostridiales bacterium]
MNNFEEILTDSQAYERLLGETQGDSFVTGAAEGLKPLIIKKIADDLKKTVLIVCENELKAREFFSSLSSVCEKTYVYPQKDMVFYSADIKSKEIVQKRFEVFKAVLGGEADFIVTSGAALFDRLIPPEIFKGSIIRLEEGDEIDLKELSARLSAMGYENLPQTEGCGTFAVRGGIIDVFSPGSKTPVRIELWGDEIDTIRAIDSFSQRSVERLNKIEIYPFKELLYSEERLLSAAVKIEKEDKALAERLRSEKSFGGIEKYINYFYDKTYSLIDYLPEDLIVVLNEESKIRADMEGAFNEYNRSLSERLEKGEALEEEKNLIQDPETALSFTEGKKRIFLSEFTDYPVENQIDFKSRSIKGYSKDLESLCSEIRGYFKRSYCVIGAASGTAEKERLEKALTDAEISMTSKLTLEKNMVSLIKTYLPSFVSDELKTVFINEAKPKRAKGKRRRRKFKDGARIADFSDLKPGDYVVHENHGIGIYRGLEQVETDGILKDYLSLEYADGGKLYVSVGQLESVQKYIGGDTAKLKLNSLGGTSWAKAKAKAGRAVKELAFDLVKLYGVRQMKLGYKYSPDTVWQNEFEDAFPYDETEDQLEAVADIKRDMEAGKIMDRLVCGDVGYGKTEVALRAAFKVICEGKQAAFLVPTTILANQHYQNILERFADYPVNIDMLSRFKTKQQQSVTIQKLKSGEVDFVVGTHRLLSDDVKFKDLGLVIVDEEQRFGVGHKEKLKRMTENVDVLTLSATPIPRTLHMSLSGIRDMSVLNEPPEDRLPVQTYVMEYSEETVRTAVLRELARDGQVYFLHNRVQTIDEAADKLRRLIPEAKIGVGHGQMRERELENVLTDFLNKEINVLVCTTIIETGMDIQNVNTMIIENADYMGLSQLYQLRGRVGRTNRQAYCYLCYQKNKTPSEISEKRLKTIKEFTEFGSGFKIALRDLEIRGAGDLLGASQHGHMDKIGYDMYCRILDKAIRELKGETTEEEIETFVDINVNAFIPSTYISDEVQKLEMYKKISYILNKNDYDETADELTDRFGEYPKVVENLMDIALLKEKARKLKIISISGRSSSVLLTFKNGANPDTDKILSLIKEYRGRISLTASGETYLTYKTETTGSKLIDELNGIIDKIS